MAYTSVYYRDDGGDEPVKDFIEDLNFKVQQKFFARDEQLLGSFGEKMPPPHTEQLEDGIYELKVDFSNLAYRFLYVLHGKTVVYLHAFQKKTDKVPRREIELALDRRKHFFQQLQKDEIEL